MKILFVAPRFPLPPVKGDKVRAWQFIRALAQAHEVTLVSYTASEEERAYVPEMAHHCNVRVLPFHRARRTLGAAYGALNSHPFQVHYYRSNAMMELVGRELETCDVVHLNTLRMVGNLPATFDKPLVVDFIDALSLGMSRRANRAGGILGMGMQSETRRLRALEQKLLEQADLSIVVGQHDADALGGDSAVIPIGVDTDRFTPAGQPTAAPIAIFTGNMNYAPNIEAAKWLAESIWPRVVRQCPGATLRLAGINPAQAVKSLASESIEVTGYVADMAAALHDAAIAVAPMRSGSGLQIKVLEAMACGLPVVASSLANAAVGAPHGGVIRIADETDALAGEIVALLKDEGLRRQAGAAAREFVETKYSLASVATNLLTAYRALDTTPAP